jgi:hypothetical protein
VDGNNERGEKLIQTSNSRKVPKDSGSYTATFSRISQAAGPWLISTLHAEVTCSSWAQKRPQGVLCKTKAIVPSPSSRQKAYLVVNLS